MVSGAENTLYNHEYYIVTVGNQIPDSAMIESTHKQKPSGDPACQTSSTTNEN